MINVGVWIGEMCVKLYGKISFQDNFIDYKLK